MPSDDEKRDAKDTDRHVTLTGGQIGAAFFAELVIPALYPRPDAPPVERVACEVLARSWFHCPDLQPVDFVCLGAIFHRWGTDGLPRKRTLKGDDYITPAALSLTFALARMQTVGLVAGFLIPASATVDMIPVAARAFSIFNEWFGEVFEPATRPDARVTKGRLSDVLRTFRCWGGLAKQAGILRMEKGELLKDTGGALAEVALLQDPTETKPEATDAPTAREFLIDHARRGKHVGFYVGNDGRYRVSAVDLANAICKEYGVPRAADIRRKAKSEPEALPLDEGRDFPTPDPVLRALDLDELRAALDGLDQRDLRAAVAYHLAEDATRADVAKEHDVTVEQLRLAEAKLKPLLARFCETAEKRK